MVQKTRLNIDERKQKNKKEKFSSRKEKKKLNNEFHQSDRYITKKDIAVAHFIALYKMT